LSINVCYGLLVAKKAENKDSLKESQEAILQAACQVFCQKGYHQARMADVAKEADISYGLVYHYFGSKAELFDALIKKYFAPVDVLLDHGLEGYPTIREKLGAIVDQHLQHYFDHRDLVHLYIREISRSTSNLTPARLARFKKLISRVEEIMREGQAKGELRRDIRASYQAHQFLGAVETLISSMVMAEQPLKDQAQCKRISNAILTLFFEGAKPQPA